MSRTRRLNSARKDRLSSAALALLLQALFIAAFLHAFSQSPPPARQLIHDITFFLPRLPKPAPMPSNQAPRATAPLLTPPIFAPPPVVAVPLLEAPSVQSLQNFGQALQGCAPEDYANLTPEQKARCTRPGEGVAIQQYPDPLHPPHPAKDEANWQEQFRRAHLPYPECPPSDSWLGCETGMRHVELAREKQTDSELAYQKEQALKPAERPLPQHLGALPRALTETVGVHPK